MSLMPVQGFVCQVILPELLLWNCLGLAHPAYIYKQNMCRCSGALRDGFQGDGRTAIMLEEGLEEEDFRRSVRGKINVSTCRLFPLALLSRWQLSPPFDPK